MRLSELAVQMEAATRPLAAERTAEPGADNPITGSVAASAVPRPRELSEMQPQMLKADVRKAESDLRAAIGAVIQRAAASLGWSLKELAASVDRDPRQVARWLNGHERAPFDLLWAVEDLRQPLVVAFAELCEGCEVTTHISVSRTA